jgi:hypothetical protein
LNKPNIRELVSHMRFEDDVEISEFIDMSPREGAKALRENPDIAGEMVLCRQAEATLSTDSEATPDYLKLVRKALEQSAVKSPTQQTLKALATEAGLSLQDLADALDVSSGMVALLNLRSIDVASIPARFFTVLAQTLSQTVENVRSAVGGTTMLSPQMMYLSAGKPSSVNKIDFMEELEADPDVPDAGRMRWKDPGTGSE